MKKELDFAVKLCFSVLCGGKLPAVFVGDGEFLAAVTTAGRENAAAVGGSHTLAETVLVDTFAAGGLECPFHFYPVFIFSVRAHFGR